MSCSYTRFRDIGCPCDKNSHCESYYCSSSGQCTQNPTSVIVLIVFSILFVLLVVFSALCLCRLNKNHREQHEARKQKRELIEADHSRNNSTYPMQPMAINP